MSPEVIDYGYRSELIEDWRTTAHEAIEEIREQRRQRLRSVSDEALYDAQWMTRRIAELRGKGAH